MSLQLSWQEKWEKGAIPWQRTTVHPVLTEHSNDLDFTPPKRVFLPFCGKCPELLWFYEKGLEVVGVELIELPVKDFFKENNLQFQVTELSWAKVYETPDKRLKIYVANIFEINSDDVGKFDIIWNRRVLTALQIADRERFSKLLRKLCKKDSVHLLLTLQFAGDPNVPPRPVSHETTQKMFGDWCKIKLVLQRDYESPFIRNKGFDEVLESYHLLTPK